MLARRSGSEAIRPPPAKSSYSIEVQMPVTGKVVSVLVGVLAGGALGFYIQANLIEQQKVCIDLFKVVL